MIYYIFHLWAPGSKQDNNMQDSISGESLKKSHLLESSSDILNMEEGSSIIGRGNSLDYSKVGEHLHNYIWQKKSFFSVIFDGSMFSMEPNVIKFCLNLQWYWRRRLSSSARDPCIGFHQKTVSFLQVEKFLFSKLESFFPSSWKVSFLQVWKFFLFKLKSFFFRLKCWKAQMHPFATFTAHKFRKLVNWRCSTFSINLYTNIDVHSFADTVS